MKANLKNAKNTYLAGLPVMLLLMVLFSAPLQAQDLRKKISIDAENLPLKEVIAQIEQESGLYFSYSPQSVPVDMPISLQARNKSLKFVLKKVFRKNDIKYALIGNHIVLKSTEESYDPAYTPDPSSLEQYTLSGYLKDRSSGEVLIGAHIYEKAGYTGTATNAYGFYSLSLAEGVHEIVFSFIGYEPVEMTVLLDRDKKIDQEMKEGPLTIQEVEIVGRTDQPVFLNDQISEFRFSRKTLSNLPGITGDRDIIKSLQVIPGVKSFGDGSSLFFVRGGGSDQNLILVDEVPMYNASHLFGFLSVISPDAISDMEVYKGDFPAKYGGRLSSVVDIKTKDGNNKRFGFGGNAGPYTSSLYLEGPLIRNKSSFYLAGRVSTLQWLPQLYFDNQDISVGFFDINAKLNFKLGERDRLFATFYIGNDLLERETSNSIETFGLGWNNLLGTIRWNHVFNKKLFSNTTVYLTRYQYLMYLRENRKEYWNSEISTFAFKEDLTWYINPNNTFKAGMSIKAYGLDAGNINLEDEEAVDPLDIPSYNCAEYVFYAGNQQSIANKLILRYGLRLPVWQDLGPTTVYYFDNNYTVIDTFMAEKNAVYSSFTSLEPRINITWLMTGSSSLKAGYSRTTQFLNELNNSISPFTSLSVWVPSGPNIAPRKADQYSMGYFGSYSNDRIKFSAETYYKHYYNYIDYAPHANMLYNPLIEGELRSGEAWSYGLELMLRKPFGKLTGWLGYTYSRVFVKTPGVNMGASYPAFQDRPHHLTLFVNYELGKRWNLTANWILLSGAAISTPLSFYDYNGYAVPVYGEKNNDRLPTYHRLDLSVNFRLNRNPEARFRHNIIVNLYNAYGRTNPYFLSYNRVEDQGEYVVPADHLSPRYRVPTALSVSEIIPSINYQFRF